MIPPEQQIPHLLYRLRDEIGLEKTSSLVDAIVGAPVGAVAARLSAGERDKDEATRRGLIVGALLGWLAGQRAVDAARRGERQSPLHSPLVASAAGGAGVGLYSRARHPVSRLIGGNNTEK